MFSTLPFTIYQQVFTSKTLLQRCLLKHQNNTIAPYCLLANIYSSCNTENLRWGYPCWSLECLSSTQLHPWPATSAMRQDTATTVWTTSTWSVRWGPSGPGRVWGSTAAWWSPPVPTCVSRDLRVSGSGTKLLQTMWWEGGFWRNNFGEDIFGIKWQKQKVR